MARAVLVAVVAPNVSSRRVGGSPIPGRVDGQPSPGTCVTAMADPWRSDPEPGSAGDDVIDFPTAHFGPCDGAVVGEVASIDTALPPERIDANDYQNAVAQCALDAIGYLGFHPPCGGTRSRTAGQPLDFRAELPLHPDRPDRRATGRGAAMVGLRHPCRDRSATIATRLTLGSERHDTPARG